MAVQRAMCCAIVQFFQVCCKEFHEEAKGCRSVIQCMEMFEDEDTLQAAACEALAYLAATQASRSQMAGVKAVELVLKAIKNHVDNSDVVLSACKAIAHLVQDDFAQQKELIQCKMHHCIVDALQNYHEVKEVVEQICWTLKALVSTDEVGAMFLDGDGDGNKSTPAMVTTALRHFKGIEEIQTAGLGLLETLYRKIDLDKYCTQVTILARDCRATELILAAMMNFPNCSQIQEFGCSLIDSLAEANKRLKLDYLDTATLKTIYNAMLKNPGLDKESRRVQEAACRAMSKMLNVNPHLTDQIGEGEMPWTISADDSGVKNEENMQILLHRTLTYALMMYFNHNLTFKAACSAVFYLAVNGRLAECLVKSGSQIAILFGINLHEDDRSAREWGCRAIRRLCASSSSKELLVDCGVVSGISKLMERCPDDRVALEEAIGNLACLASQSLEGFSPDVYNMILDAMKKFQDCERLQTIALETMTAMATAAYEEEREERNSPDLPSAEAQLESKGTQFIGCLNRAGAQRCVVSSMEKNLNSPDVQKNGCLALCQLRHPNREEPRCLLNSVASAIKKAMERYLNTADVLIEGCLAVFKLTQHDGRFAAIFVDHRVHLVLFNIVNYFSDKKVARRNGRLLELITNCLFLFRDVKDLMLQYAVEGGHFAAATCLLEIMGADVNASKDATPFICVAAQRRNIKMVQLLLKHNAANLRSALEIAVELGYDNIVGLLLHHTSWNKEHRIANWDGLKLSSLNPMWLYPMLRLPISPSDVDSEKKRVKKIPESPNTSHAGDSGAPSNAASNSIPTVNEGNGFEENDKANDDPERAGQSPSSSSVRTLATDHSLSRRRATVIGDVTQTKLSRHGSIALSPLPRKFGRSESFESSNLRIDLVDDMTMTEAVQALQRAAMNMEIERGEHGMAMPACSENDAKMKTGKFFQHTESGAALPFKEFPHVEHEVSKQLQRSFTGSQICRSMNRAGNRLRQCSSPSEQYHSLFQLNVSSNGIITLEDVAGGETDMLKRLEWMENLIASQNRLESFPISLNEWLINLRGLYLQNNEISNFPLHLLRLKSLQTLDLSYNKIETLPAAFDSASPLTTINLSHNQIRKFPQWLFQCTPNLSSLNMSHNGIRELQIVPLGLAKLKKLNLSHNAIAVLPDCFLSKCRQLESLDLSWNELVSLPTAETAALLGDLTKVFLNDNKFGSREFSASTIEVTGLLPDFVLKLPRLQNVNVSRTELAFLPGPEHWSTMSLSTLRASENTIDSIDLGDASHHQWNFLTCLNLRKNQLKEIPAGIGRLSDLAFFDVSLNNSITKLPLEMGKLEELIELSLEGLKIDFPCDITRCRTKQIINILKIFLEECEKYHHVRLVVMGDESCGKTRLLKALTNRLPLTSRSKRGIQTVDWNVSIESKKKRHSSPEIGGDYQIHCWECSGAEKYKEAYQCFEASGGFFMIVYKLDPLGSKSEIKSVRSWLLNIEARAPMSTVLAIGTHLDVVEATYANAVQTALENFRRKPGFPKNIFFHFANYKQPKALRKEVIKAMFGSDFKTKSLTDQMVPKRYQSLLNCVLKEAEKITNNKKFSFPAISHLRMTELAATAKLEKEHLPQAIQFLRKNSTVIHFDDINILSDYFILDPAWLCDVIARVRETDQPHGGVVERTTLIKLYEDLMRATNIPTEAFLQILEKFEIAMIFGDHYLVPSLLPKEKPAIPADLLPNSSVVHRLYCLAYIPTGFWSHLIAKIQAFSHEMTVLTVTDSGKHFPDQSTFWKTGLNFYWNSKAFVVIQELQEDIIDVLVPKTRYGTNILGIVVDHIDSLIEEWYPGLLEIDIQGNPLVRKRVPCPFCTEPDVHYFELDDLIDISSKGNSAFCPKYQEKVLLRHLAPDVMMTDLESSYHIESFEFDKSPSFLLGRGGFGAVYKAKHSGENVAVKVFHSFDGVAACHQQLRQEISVLQHRHPSIVRLVGISLMGDRLLLMELAPHGSLDQLFRDKATMTRPLQHRIAWQVAEGLDFLHQLGIAYRDLKPSNMLVFSTATSAGVPVNVKLTDFGIACFVPPAGLSESKGTSSHRAPQVIKGQSYGLQADIYSYGLFLFEMVTNGKKLFNDFASQPKKIDDLISQQSVAIPNSEVCSITKNGAPQWPDMQDLICHCLQHQSEDRPTANDVVERLSKAEFFCLKGAISVDGETSIEAITVRKYQKSVSGRTSLDGLEVWMASGTDFNSSQITISNLSREGSQPYSFPLEVGGICCLLAVCDSLVLAGTLSGRLWVFDANRKEAHCSHFIELPDAVFCLFHFADPSSDDNDCVLAGLGNGQVAKFDTKKLCSELNSQPSFFCLGRESPVTAISSGAKQLWYCHGSEIVVFQDSNFRKEEKRWKANEGTVSLSHICVGGGQVWTATKKSPRLRLWDAENFKPRGEVNCADAFRDHCGQQHKLQMEWTCPYRVVSMQLISRESLWVGTGSGHILLYCPIKLTLLVAMCRSDQPVRCIAHATGRIEEKLVNVALTGCRGFSKSAGKQASKDKSSLLIWDCDLHRQEQELHEYQAVRNLNNSCLAEL
eukprot:m.247504 g.247504  ORF g.247504 m.247504 type:complete len:2547 (+) comp40272_c0_seq11:2181-9821(+)